MFVCAWLGPRTAWTADSWSKSVSLKLQTEETFFQVLVLGKLLEIRDKLLENERLPVGLNTGPISTITTQLL